MAWTVGIPSALITLLTGAAAVRRHQRNQVEDDLLTNLPGVLGWSGRVDRSLLQCRKWTGGFRGYPAQIIAAHSATKRVEDVAWQLQLRASLLQILPGLKFSLAPHPTHHLRIVIACTPLEEPGSEKQDESDRQADHVATVMGEIFTSSAEVELHREGEAVRSITVKHDRGNDMAMKTRRQRIERIVSARLTGDWRSSWDLVNNEVSFTKREPLPALVFPPQEQQAAVITHKDYEQLFIPYGVGENDEVLGWRPKVQPHMLVCGPTNGGKTTIEHQIIERLAQAGCKLWLCDGKRIEFMGFRGWPNVELIAAKTEHKVRMIQAFFEEMNRRYDLIESGTKRVSDMEPIFMVVDEAATIVTQAGLWFGQVKPKGARSSKAPVMDWLGDIARLSRSAKMHILVGLQRPDVRFLDGEMRDNFACRASVGKLGADGAQMMWGNPHTGAGPSPVPGRGWTTTQDGRVVEAQFHFAPNPDSSREEYDTARVAAVKPNKVVHEPHHIEVLDPDEVDLNGDPVLLDFNDYMEARILEGPDPTWGKLYNHDDQDADAAATSKVQADVEGSPVEPQLAPAQAVATKAKPRLYLVPTEEEDEADGEESQDDDDDESVMDPGAGIYDTQVLSLTAPQLQEGYLVLMDEGLELWGVVETLSAEDTGVVIDYRILGTGEPECLTLDDSAVLQVRCPLDTDD